MATDKTYTFLNPDPLARTVVTWLWIDLATSILGSLASLATIVETAGLDASQPKDTLLATDIPVALVAVVQGIVTLVTGFLVLKWIYRVTRNAHSAVRGLEVSPPWAVGWFFVPVAFLWKPFQAFRDTWQASSDPQRWRTVRIPPMLNWWWALFLISNFLSQISFRISMAAGTLGGMAAASGFDLVSALVAVPLDLIFIRIVRDLTQKQVVDLTFGDARAAA